LADNVYYSINPYGAGDLKVACNIEITGGSGIATFSESQTGNIGVGCHVISDNIDGYISDVASPTVMTIVTALGVAHGNISLEVLTSIAHEYASISAFIAGCTDADHINDTDLTNADVIANGPFYVDQDDQTPDTTFPTISGITTDATRRINLYAPNSAAECISDEVGGGFYQRHDGKLNTNAALLSIASNTNVIDIANNNVTLEGFQGIFTGNWGTPFMDVDANTGIEIIDSILDCNDKKPRGIYTNGAAGIEFINTLIYDATQHGFFNDFGGGTQTFFNCTITGCVGTGVRRTSGTITTTNCALFDNADDIFGTVTIVNCATEEGAGEGSNGVAITQTASNYAALVTDYSILDFSVKDASSELYNAGTNAGAPNDDIIGTSRPQSTTVDIGAFEFVVGAPPSGAIPLLVGGGMGQTLGSNCNLMTE